MATRKTGVLISQRLAVSVISVLFGATVAGWLLTEVFPADFPFRSAEYTEKWGDAAVKACNWLKLYDPFHSFWFSGILTLFFIVLLLCVISRWKDFILRSFRISVTGMWKKIPEGAHGARILWLDPLGSKKKQKDPIIHYAEKYGIDGGVHGDLKEKIYLAVSSVFRKNKFSMSRSDGKEGLFFSAVAGRWRFFGNFLFHLGLLVITAGGMVGSLMGRSEILYGKSGDIIPLYKSKYSIRVDSFRIILSSGREVSDYLSTLSVVDSEGSIVKTVEIEVNHPLRFDGYYIYQSSYYVSDKEFVWARLKYQADPGDIPARVILKSDEEAKLAGTGYTIRAGKFFPDFRMGDSGPYSASSVVRNPALEVRLSSGDGSRTGYLFPLHPRFNSRFDHLFALTVEDIEPVYYTGLLITSNPGSPVLWTGMILASIGLVLLYIFDYRCINGYIGPDRMVMYIAGGRWKVSLREKFDSIETQVREKMSLTLGGID